MNSYLVTGSAGFIGNCFVRMLLDEGHHVVSVDNLSYSGNMETIQDIYEHPHHKFVSCGIGDIMTIAHYLRDNKVRCVVNFAAESHVDRSIDMPLAFVKNNTVGTCSLLSNCHDYWISQDKPDDFRFIQISTDEVFGSVQQGLFTEGMPYDPSSPYSASKAAADHFVRAFHRTYGFPTLITNCSNNYGPYQYPEKLIPLMIARCDEWLSLPIYGDGRQVRDWIHVDDHCRAISHVIDKGTVGETYLVGASQQVENVAIVDEICDIMDSLKFTEEKHCSLIDFVQDRPGHDRRYAVDWSKLADLGWQPEVDFSTGLRDTVQWYLNNRDWVQAVSNKVHRRRQGTL